MLINPKLAYFGWGLILAVMPPFYPSEAEKKGATPSQVEKAYPVASAFSLFRTIPPIRF